MSEDYLGKVFLWETIAINELGELKEDECKVRDTFTLSWDLRFVSICLLSLKIINIILSWLQMPIVISSFSAYIGVIFQLDL